jgi:hypothetical protein
MLAESLGCQKRVFAGQKFTGRGFDQRSYHFQQGLLLRTPCSREEVAQFDLGDVSAGRREIPQGEARLHNLTTSPLLFDKTLKKPL